MLKYYIAQAQEVMKCKLYGLWPWNIIKWNAYTYTILKTYTYTSNLHVKK